MRFVNKPNCSKKGFPLTYLEHFWWEFFSKCVKAVTYDEWPKMKRYTQEKCILEEFVIFSGKHFPSNIFLVESILLMFHSQLILNFWEETFVQMHHRESRYIKSINQTHNLKIERDVQRKLNYFAWISVGFVEVIHPFVWKRTILFLKKHPTFQMSAFLTRHFLREEGRLLTTFYRHLVNL